MWWRGAEQAHQLATDRAAAAASQQHECVLHSRDCGTPLAGFVVARELCTGRCFSVEQRQGRRPKQGQQSVQHMHTARHGGGSSRLVWLTAPARAAGKARTCGQLDLGTPLVALTPHKLRCTLDCPLACSGAGQNIVLQLQGARQAIRGRRRRWLPSRNAVTSRQQPGNRCHGMQFRTRRQP